ncbi:hypothetical protein DFJ58DRAFT_846293 [Suillus subalutaceus]|uniref:uncharacterized protein n=1 Tax=Suillus subalutaceus TaxID=48586 RepID=UPI001B880920|nr:uncharacterized protein DFJ58DRAFT_846293 [Suillus subalutaceus]KAG1837835.1 hypothetical protein DFJ58DRAFT_846293 [Suillus subalutaceus]
MTLPRFQTFISLPSLLTGVLSRRSGMRLHRCKAVVDSRTMRQFSLHDSYTLPNLHLLAVAPYGGSEPSLWLVQGCRRQSHDACKAVVDSRTIQSVLFTRLFHASAPASPCRRSAVIDDFIFDLGWRFKAVDLPGRVKAVMDEGFELQMANDGRCRP